MYNFRHMPARRGRGGGRNSSPSSIFTRQRGGVGGGRSNRGGASGGAGGLPEKPVIFEAWIVRRITADVLKWWEVSVVSSCLLISDAHARPFLSRFSFRCVVVRGLLTWCFYFV
jgi:hypothetical protein